MIQIGEVVSGLGWVIVVVGTIWLYRIRYREAGQDDFMYAIFFPFLLLTELAFEDGRKAWLINVVGVLIIIGGLYIH